MNFWTIFINFQYWRYLTSLHLFYFISNTQTVNLQLDSPIKRQSIINHWKRFPVEKANRNKRKLAALNKENCEEHPRSDLAQNSNVPRPQEDYRTQLFEEIEGRVTEKLSQEFSKTENPILGALAQFDDFLMNPLVQGHSGTTPETSRNVFSVRQGTNEDDSQSNPHPEAGLFNKQMKQNSGPQDGHDMVTVVQREGLCGHDMVAGVQRDGLCGHDMTGVHEEVTYCSPSTSSGKQKKNRSTSQPQFRSENTPATIEADQIFLALQQLANYNNAAIFQNNINRISKLPESVTTTMPTFDGKSEELELFEDLVQTSLKFHNQLTEEDRINYFHSLMWEDATQTFNNINGPTRENLWRKFGSFSKEICNIPIYGPSETQIPETCLQPSISQLSRFSRWTPKSGQRRIRICYPRHQWTIHIRQMPPQLKKSRNLAHLENGIYKQIVTHLERELELKGLEAPDELQINTVSHTTANANADRPKPTCHHCRKPGHYRKLCRLLKKQREQTENNQNNLGNKNSDANTSNPNCNVNNRNNDNKNSNRAEKKPKTVYPPCETCGKADHSSEKCYYGANAANRPPPRQRRPERQNQVQERANQNDSNETTQTTAQNLNWKCHVFTPELRLTDRR